MSDRVPLSRREFYCTDTRLIVRSAASSKADAPQHHEVNHSVGRTRLLRHEHCRFHPRDLSPREWPPAALSRHRTPLMVFENKYRYSWLVLFSHEVEGQEGGGEMSDRTVAGAFRLEVSRSPLCSDRTLIFLGFRLAGSHRRLTQLWLSATAQLGLVPSESERHVAIGGTVSQIAE